MELAHTEEETDIVIGECLTKDEAQDIISVLVRDGAVQDLLVDAQLRSDQHRHNYAALKTQHEGLLHQLRLMEAELERAEADKEELQAQLGALADSAVSETEHLKREIAYLEAQIPSDNANREIENRIREETEIIWKEKCSVLAEENSSLNDLITVLQQENTTLRATFKSDMAELEQNMQETVLEFESKLNNLEKENLILSEAPEKAEKMCRQLLQENAELSQKNDFLSECNEDLRSKNMSFQKRIQETESKSQDLESGMRLNLRQSTAKISGLEKLIESLYEEIAEKEKDKLDQEDRLRTLIKDNETDKEKLGESERNVQVKISSLEMSKAREFSSLKRELSILNQKKSEMDFIIENLQKELDDIKEKHNVNVSVKDEEILELKCDLQDSIQNFETQKMELQSKLKGLGMALHDVEDENQRLKNERARMVRDFNEDMSRISFQNQDMKENIQFLKDQLGANWTSKSGRNQEDAIKHGDKLTHKGLSPQFEARVNEDDYTELHKKCRKYNKLIHKLREKILQLGSSEEMLRAEKAALERDLSDIKLRHKQFGAVFTQLEETKQINEIKSDKLDVIDDVKNSIDELDKKSNEYLEKRE